MKFIQVIHMPYTHGLNLISSNILINFIHESFTVWTFPLGCDMVNQQVLQAEHSVTHFSFHLAASKSHLLAMKELTIPAPVPPLCVCVCARD